jgi:hypothetical protein
LIDPHRLEAEAQVATGDAAVGEQLRCYTFDCLGWDDKHASSGTKHCHSDDLSIDVESGSPFRPCIELQIEMEPAVDMPPAKAPPGAARKSHNAEGGARPFRLATSRKHKMSDAEPGRLSEWHIGNGLLLGPQEGNVSAWIPTDEACPHLVSIRSRDQNVLVRLQRFFCGEDKSGTPDDACR